MRSKHFRTLCTYRNQPNTISLANLLKSGFTPTVSHFNQFLLFLLQNKSFRSVIHIFSQLKSNRINGNSFTNSIFTSALLKDRKYDDAFQLLKTHAKRHSIPFQTRLFDCLIQGLCVHEKDPEKALCLLRDWCTNNCILPSSFTFCSLIHTFSSEGKMNKAIEVLEMMVDERINYPCDNFVCSSVISGFVKIGKPELAIGFYENAIKKGVLPPNVVTYTALSSAYCHMGRIAVVSGLVCSIQKAGLGFDTVFYSNWICEYFREGIVEEALLKYREMRERKIGMDTVSYTILIDGFSKEGNVEKAVGFLYKMKNDGLQPNLVTYTAIMMGFCKKGKMSEALEVLKTIKNLDFKLDEFVYAVLIDGFCRQGNFGLVFNLLDEMAKEGVKPGVVTYNTVINGLCKVGRTSEADELSNNITGDAITYRTLLYGYIKEENIKGMLETKRRLEEANVHVNIELYNMLIKALVMFGSFEEAFEIYGGIEKLGLCADSVTYHIMIDGYCKAGRIGEALEIFDGFRMASFSSVGCYNSIICGLCRQRLVGMAIEVFTELSERGLILEKRTCKMLIKLIFEEQGDIGVFSFISRIKNLGSEMFDIIGNVTILFLTKRGFLEPALDIYFVMMRKRAAISSRSYYSVTKLLICVQNIPLAFSLISSFVKEYGIFESRLIKALVYYYCISNVSNALKFFARTKDSSLKFTVPPAVIKTLIMNDRILDAYMLLSGIEGTLPAMDVVDYSVLIHCLCKAGNIDKALDLCAFVRERGICLNIVTYNSIINGLCCEGCLGEAFRLFDSLENLGMFPSGITYTTLIDALSKGGFLLDAEKLFERMINGGFKPNTHVYNSLIHGYCRVGQIQEALKLLHDLEQNLLNPDGFTISAVIDGFCQRGDMEGALSFFLEFKRRSIKPDLLGFVSLLRGLCSKGRMEESRSVLREMLQTSDIVDLLNRVHFDVEMESALDFLVLLCEQGNIEEALTILNEIASVVFLSKSRRSSRTNYVVKKQRELSDVNRKMLLSHSSETLEFDSSRVSKSAFVAKNCSLDTENFYLQDFNSYYAKIASLCAKGEMQKASEFAKLNFRLL